MLHPCKKRKAKSRKQKAITANVSSEAGYLIPIMQEAKSYCSAFQQQSPDYLIAFIIPGDSFLLSAFPFLLTLQICRHHTQQLRFTPGLKKHTVLRIQKKKPDTTNRYWKSFSGNLPGKKPAPSGTCLHVCNSSLTGKPFPLIFISN